MTQNARLSHSLPAGEVRASRKGESLTANGSLWHGVVGSRTRTGVGTSPFDDLAFSKPFRGFA